MLKVGMKIDGFFADRYRGAVEINESSSHARRYTTFHRFDRALSQRWLQSFLDYCMMFTIIISVTLHATDCSFLVLYTNDRFMSKNLDI